MAPFILEAYRQRTDSGSCDLREEDELWLPQRLTNIHTELRDYKCGLWNDEGGVPTREVKEMLTRVTVMGTFFSLTKEGVTIVSGY